VDQLNALMEAAQKTAYLDVLADDGWNPRFWSSKLHFYISGLPFYNFPYTFGYLLSMGLYAVAREAGGEFAETYRRLLIATGCQDAEAAARVLGQKPPNCCQPSSSICGFGRSHFRKVQSSLSLRNDNKTWSFLKGRDFDNALDEYVFFLGDFRPFGMHGTAETGGGCSHPHC
jgi:oligoendopeptidase F